MNLPRVLFLGCLVAVLACGSSGTIIGTIYVIGNEPFTEVAVEDSTGTLYRIETTKELERQLRVLQGRKVGLRYTKLTTTEIGKSIAVESIHEAGHQ